MLDMLTLSRKEPAAASVRGAEPVSSPLRNLGLKILLAEGGPITG